jgi:hypothetical protein
MRRKSYSIGGGFLMTLRVRFFHAPHHMKLLRLLALFAVLISTAQAVEKPSAHTQGTPTGKPTGLAGHLNSHVKFPATGKAIKESCKKEMPDEFSKEQGAYFDSKLKDDTTYKNPEEVLSALNLKQSKRQ